MLSDEEIRRIAEIGTERVLRFWPDCPTRIREDHIARGMVMIASVQPMLASAGYSIVPNEPTEVMIRAGDEVMYGRYGCSFEVSPIYRAMLAALARQRHDGE
jgi:hypothetical protein